MMKLRIIACAVILIFAAAGLALRTDSGPDERVVLEGLVSGEVFHDGKQGAPPHYVSPDGMVAFNTHEVVPSIRGYAGPIKLLIALDPAGKIAGLRLLDHRETRNYVRFMETPEYLGRFVGKSVHDPFEADRDVDAISRATVSVEALARTVREASRSVAAQVYGIEVHAAGGPVMTGRAWVLYPVLFCLALAGYFLSRRSKRFLKSRDTILVASIGITGILLASPFSIIHVYNLILYGPAQAALWIVLVVSTLGSLLIAGRFYCGWLCPFGALSEFIARIPLRKWAVHPDMDMRWRKMKYLFFCIATCAVLIAGRSDFGNFETYIALFSFNGSFLIWLLVGVTLFANLRVGRFWCRYLCPVAALTGLASFPARGYPSAGNCPMSNSPSPHQSECIRCNRCFHEVRPDA